MHYLSDGGLATVLDRQAGAAVRRGRRGRTGRDRRLPFALCTELRGFRRAALCEEPAGFEPSKEIVATEAPTGDTILPRDTMKFLRERVADLFST